MTSIAATNAVLARHGALLDAIWQGEITRIGDDNARAIGELKVIQAVLTDEEGNVRLARNYREYIERVLGQRGRYGASRSIADDVQRLLAATTDANEAHARQDQATCDRAIAEGSDIIWELADTIETTTLSFERILHEGLGETGTRAARARRLEFYRQRIEALREGLNMLVSGPAREELSNAACRDLRLKYSRMIGDRLGGIVQRVTRASTEISRLLILDRDILAQTRRTRAMLRALKDVSTSERADVLALDGDFVLPEFSFAPLVDPRDPELDSLRETIASKMQPVTRRRPVKVEEAGILLDLPPDVTLGEPVVSVDERLAVGFAEAIVPQAPLSLRQWLAEHAAPEDRDMAFEVILSGILARDRAYAIEFVPPLDPLTSSRIHDILVSRAA
ncbi:hypothetical protein LAZ40_05650 [Cereibacter sphaeroides]|uniref:hypothetical protein n=1 Tax=Cereibacter sphaeroides TaxID=1063 RepID=UPI001F368A39|nr:hypothetical protein [Cereibacter sphaeroides]MCE6958534.1 hypothetical protein [Cereibacter sphaeroides]MCE6972803.1 hypothetical protein [Cereibacter sphaeroides]